MTIYIIPAILALISTAYILVYASKNQGQSRTFFTMVLVFLAHHICETIGFFEFIKDGPHIIYQLKIYYIASVWSLVFIFKYAQEVSEIKVRHLDSVFITLATITSILILSGSSIIAGATSWDYVMTAQKGNLYFLFQTLSLSLLCSTIAHLFIGYRKSNSHTVQIQCLYMIIAFTPLLMTAFGLLTLMQFGININAIAIIPISSTLFLLITFKSETKHKLTDLRRFMPFSPERKTSQDIMEIYSKYARDELAYRECINEIEKLLVLQKYIKNGNNASATAETMGMPRSSLYSIFNRLSIDVKSK